MSSPRGRQFSLLVQLITFQSRSTGRIKTSATIQWMTKNIRAHLFVLAAVVWSLIPLVVLAQGLVPCTGLDCQACHIAKLAQNVINFLVVVSIPIAAAMFAAAGFLYFTSGVNLKHIDWAKGIFWNAFIGFLIAISAWLVVQTILRVTLSSEFYRGWNTIQCTTSTRLMNKSVGDFLSTLPSLNYQTPPTLSVNPTSINDLYPNSSRLTCQGEGFLYSSNTGACYNPETGQSQQPTFASSFSYGLGNTGQYAPELGSICTQQGFNDCATAQAVMAVESNGRANAISSAGCVGLMQVCPGTARVLDPSLAGLSDSQVTQRLMDPTYNMNLGVQYLSRLQNQFGASENMIAAYNGGPRANTASVTCPGQTYWQCNANAGYLETRNYVPRVLAARNQIR